MASVRRTAETSSDCLLSRQRVSRKPQPPRNSRLGRLPKRLFDRCPTVDVSDGIDIACDHRASVLSAEFATIEVGGSGRIVSAVGLWHCLDRAWQQEWPNLTYRLKTWITGVKRYRCAWDEPVALGLSGSHISHVRCVDPSIHNIGDRIPFSPATAGHLRMTATILPPASITASSTLRY